MTESEKRLNWAKELHQQSMDLMDDAARVTPQVGGVEQMRREQTYFVTRAHVRSMQAQTQAMISSLEREREREKR